MPDKKKKRKLTYKEQAFCIEYVKNGYNATQAAIKAGYSERTARQIATENLSKPHIQEKVQHHKDHLEELLNISISLILSEHKKIALSSIAHMYDTWIERKEFEKLTDEQKACIQEISTKTETFPTLTGAPVQVDYVKIKLYDKQKALDAITKIMGYDAPVKAELSGVIELKQITGMKVE